MFLCRSGFLLVILFFLSAMPAVSEVRPAIEFILDCSKSMADSFGGESRFQIAYQAITNAIRALPDEVPVAVRAYGHRHTTDNKTVSCSDTELIIPFDPAQSAGEAPLDKLEALYPQGYTSIAHTLKMARADFIAATHYRPVVVLLSDGEETCGGDPALEVAQLRQSGFSVTVHTVGYGVDGSTRRQLEAIARSGVGSYRGVRSPLEVASGIGQIAYSELGRLKGSFKGDGDYFLDAGDGPLFALEVKDDSVVKGFLGGGDLIDTFSISGERGDKILIELVGLADEIEGIEVEVFFSEDDTVVDGELRDDGTNNSIAVDFEQHTRVFMRMKSVKQAQPYTYSFRIIRLVSMDRK